MFLDEKNRTTREIKAWAEWLEREYVNEEFNLYLITMMFNQLPGKREAIIRQMEQEADSFYTKFVTRVYHRPKNELYLPVLLMHPDLPVPKKAKQSIGDVSINGGLHLQGILVVPVKARFGPDAKAHINGKMPLYLGHNDKIRRLHLEPIKWTPEKVVAYVFKMLSRNVFGSDYTYIRPCAKSELSAVRSI